ncbi:MAG: hypothetical protein HYR55_16860 [Acidobacteria bacterium]|nr:hypothetical protein [Acidobacteriota bacterium]
MKGALANAGTPYGRPCKRPKPESIVQFLPYYLFSTELGEVQRGRHYRRASPWFPTIYKDLMTDLPN